MHCTNDCASAPSLSSKRCEGLLLHLEGVSRPVYACWHAGYSSAPPGQSRGAPVYHVGSTYSPPTHRPRPPTSPQMAPGLPLLDLLLLPFLPCCSASLDSCDRSTTTSTITSIITSVVTSHHNLYHNLCHNRRQNLCYTECHMLCQRSDRVPCYRPAACSIGTACHLAACIWFDVLSKGSCLCSS